MRPTPIATFALPPRWDGHEVTWETMPVPTVSFICPPPEPRYCGNCGSFFPPLMVRGLRHPLDGETFDSTRAKTGRFGRTVHIPTEVPAWPVYDLAAFRCPTCPTDEVWDIRTDEWWELDLDDYGPAGSTHPDTVHEETNDA
ncbi:hypothetical protein [Marisediminicola sp. LYQ134]|uniref:hypothetical protein n=1 Tax=Marisediminicola sp. LYQ134 TaxID=3391061 RepID=UPI00398366DE